MTTFKEISGQLIRTLSSDPANPQIGQIWYNSTIGVLKGYKVLVLTWSSGGNLNTGRAHFCCWNYKQQQLVFGGYSHDLLMQLKNIMDQLGQLVEI
jgi:hypothetical protein